MIFKAGSMGIIIAAALIALGGPLGAEASTPPSVEATAPSVEGVANQAPPSIVKVTALAPKKGGASFRKHVGTGFLFGSDGRQVLTAAHLLTGYASLTVTDPHGKEHTATVVSVDHRTDLAVLRLRSTAGPAVTLATEPARVGQDVTTVGWISGGAEMHVAQGVVVAAANAGTDYMTIAMAMPSGMSGAPIFNAQDEVVGVAISIALGDGSVPPQGFAVPLTELRPALVRMKIKIPSP